MRPVILCILAALLLFSCSFYTSPPEDKLVVCLTFDDNCLSVYENALPALSEQGFRATVFVNSGRVGYSDRMTWEQLTELQNQHGWEIGGHTATHPNLSCLSPEEVDRVVREDYDNLRAHGFRTVSFATPYGYCPVDYYEIIGRYYRNIRTCFDLPMHAPVSRSAIGCFTTNNVTGPGEIEDRICQAELDDEDLVVLLFHDITDGPPTYGTGFSVDDFREFVIRLRRMGVKVLPLDEALNNINN